MLNVDTIKNGLVIDHIRSGSGWRIFQWLGLDKAPFCAALIMNVPSKRHGKKDMIKIDNVMDIDYSVLGFIDPNITVNVVSEEKIIKKTPSQKDKQPYAHHLSSIFRHKCQSLESASDSLNPS